MSIRLVKAPISLHFSEASADESGYLKEYQQLNESDENPIQHWVKLAKAKGDAADTDPILLSLLVELHRKIDSLEHFIKNEEPNRIPLTDKAEIESIGFEHFKLENEGLVKGTFYYGRVEMPVHPKRDVPIFFEALDSSVAKIIKIHEQDEKEWGAYLTARERVLIREAKEGKE